MTSVRKSICLHFALVI